MSTLDKSIQLLNKLPEKDIETIYTFIQFVSSHHTSKTLNNEENIDEVLKNLIGSVPDSGKTLKKYKDERMQERYGIAD